MPVNNIQVCGWKQDLIVHTKPPQFSSVTYAISHLPTEATLPPVPWKRGWGGKIWEMRWANPLFCQRRESNAFSGAASVKVPGHRQSWEEVGFGGFCFFSFSIQTFYQRYIQVTLSIKVTHKSSEAFSPRNIYFYTRQSLKKKPWQTKTEFIFPLLQFVQWTEKNQLYAHTQPQVWETPLSTYGADTFP